MLFSPTMEGVEDFLLVSPILSGPLIVLARRGGVPNRIDDGSLLLSKALRGDRGGVNALE